MFKRRLLIFACLLLCVPTFADDNTNGIYVGTPKGFYGDIDPNSLDEDEDLISPAQQQEVVIPSQDVNNEIIIPPTRTKATKDYTQIYNDLEVPTFSYLHDIDPDQYYDMKDTAWSVYPLFRLNSPLYFKNITIEPGYYLLTPREHNGEWFMLFKQNGVVKHIIPVYERDYTPETFYNDHIPKPKYTTAQKIHMGFLDFIGNFKSTKRKTPVQSYLEVNDLENYFVSIIIYYGSHKYSTIFRTIRL